MLGKPWKTCLNADRVPIINFAQWITFSRFFTEKGAKRRIVRPTGHRQWSGGRQPSPEKRRRRRRKEHRAPQESGPNETKLSTGSRFFGLSHQPGPTRMRNQTNDPEHQFFFLPVFSTAFFLTPSDVYDFF